jgi:hypothetical protein
MRGDNKFPMEFLKRLILKMFGIEAELLTAKPAVSQPAFEVIHPEVKKRPAPVETPSVDVTNPQQFLNELKSIKPAGELVDKARTDLVQELKKLAPRRRPKI